MYRPFTLNIMDTCAICLNDLICPNNIICLNNIICPIRLKCNHVFDVVCITEWFTRSKTCPYCHTELDVAPHFAPEVIDDHIFILPKYLSGPKSEVFPISLRATCQMVKKIIADRLHYYSGNTAENHCESIYKQDGRSYKILKSGIIVLKSIKPGQSNPRSLFINFKDQDRRKSMYSDLKLSDFNLIPGTTYDIYVI
jgi:hypothetical protein